MPKLGSHDFQAFYKAVAQANLYWEASAGSVRNEKGVLQAIQYNVALGSTVVRAFMEGFAIQFANVSHATAGARHKSCQIARWKSRTYGDARHP